MLKALRVALVGLLGLLLGVAVAGRPQSVPSDVISSAIVPPPSSTTTAAVATTTSTTVDPPSTVAPITSETTSTTTSTRPPPTSEPSTPSTTLVPVESVPVVVANATNIAGVAARTADRLRTLGYVDPVAADAAADRIDTVIYYIDGRHGEAVRLARQLDLDRQRVHARPGEALTVNDDAGELWLLVGEDWL